MMEQRNTGRKLAEVLIERRLERVVGPVVGDPEQKPDAPTVELKPERKKLRAIRWLRDEAPGELVVEVSDASRRDGRAGFFLPALLLDIDHRINERMRIAPGHEPLDLAGTLSLEFAYLALPLVRHLAGSPSEESFPGVRCVHVRRDPGGKPVEEEARRPCRVPDRGCITAREAPQKQMLAARGEMEKRSIPERAGRTRRIGNRNESAPLRDVVHGKLESAGGGSEQRRDADRASTLEADQNERVHVDSEPPCPWTDPRRREEHVRASAGPLEFGPGRDEPGVLDVGVLTNLDHRASRVRVSYRRRSERAYAARCYSSRRRYSRRCDGNITPRFRMPAGSNAILNAAISMSPSAP